MRSRPRLRLAGLVLAAAAVLALPAISLAHTKTFPTTVTATAQNKNKVDGTVTSPKLKCVPQRVVRIYSATGVLEARVLTDATGGFTITDKNLPAGTHFVVVKRRVLLKNHRHKHVCGSAKTSIVIP